MRKRFNLYRETAKNVPVGGELGLMILDERMLEQPGFALPDSMKLLCCFEEEHTAMLEILQNLLMTDQGSWTGLDVFFSMLVSIEKDGREAGTNLLALGCAAAKNNGYAHAEDLRNLLGLFDKLNLKKNNAIGTFRTALEEILTHAVTAMNIRFK